jgi:hypothetical protein
LQLSRVSGPRAIAAQLCFRPVRPVPSAWHEMPGSASPIRRRPARAVLSKTPPFDGRYAWRAAWRGDGGIVCRGARVGCCGLRFGIDAHAKPGHVDLVQPDGAEQGRLRAGLTGRTGHGNGFPGVHPGLVELALQAEISRGLLGFWRVAVEPRFWSSCICRPAAFPACKASSISLA